MQNVDDKLAEILWLAPNSKLAEKLGAEFRISEESRPQAPANCILAAGARANDALRTALASPDGVGAIVLLSPPALDALEADVAGRLREVEIPILTLFGTNDPASPPETGHAWRRGLLTCFQFFVYGAGADLANERPDAVAMLVTDFFRRGERFLVKTTDGKLYD
jgi:pimeloyl-ACP methyl ester carboxylesterase